MIGGIQIVCKPSCSLPDVSPGDASKVEQQRPGFCHQGAEEGHNFAG